MRSPCPRLHITVAFAVNTTVCGVIRTWVLSHRSDALTSRPLRHCPLNTLPMHYIPPHRRLRVVHGSILCDPIQPNPLQTSGKMWTQPNPTQLNPWATLRRLDVLGWGHFAPLACCAWGQLPPPHPSPDSYTTAVILCHHIGSSTYLAAFFCLPMFMRSSHVSTWIGVTSKCAVIPTTPRALYAQSMRQ